MEAIVVGKIRQDPENKKELEILNITLKGKRQIRMILRKENGIPFKKSRRPVTRIKHHSDIKYGPPSIENETQEYAPQAEGCQYFAIVNVGRGFEYGAIVRSGMEVRYYVPNTKLSVPGLYKFEILDKEKYEMYGKLKIYRVRIIEPIGM